MGKSKNLVLRATVYCLLLIFLIAVVDLQVRMNEMREEIDRKKLQIVELNDDIAECNMKLNEEKNDAYYERRARSLGYCFRGEIIFYNDYTEHGN